MTHGLSESQLKLLRCIQLQARISARDAGRACGLKEHAVAYALRRLRSQGLLLSRPLVNYSKLGCTEYDVFLRLSGSVKQSRAGLIRWANAVGNVTLLTEVGGDFQYEAVLAARHVSELSAGLAALAAHLGDVSLEKSMAIRTSNWYFGTKCLQSVRRPLPILGYDCGDPAEELDDLDRRLLLKLESFEDMKVAGLARDLAEPASTLEYRLRRLEERGIIVGYFNDYSTLNQNLGYLGFHLLVRLKGALDGFGRPFFDFCRDHPHIDILNGAIGNWDYKLLARVPSYDAVLRLVDELHERFEEKIADVRLLPMLKVHRVRSFPVLE